MRKFLLTVAVVGAFAALGGVTFAVAAPGKSADVYGVGGGRTDAGTFKFDLSAHVAGTREYGHVGVTQTAAGNQVSLWIDVDCVIVAGHDAVIGGEAQKVRPVPNTFGFADGDRFIVLVHDGGNPSAAPVDGFVAFKVTGNCGQFSSGTFMNVTQGNITVKSA